MAKISKGFDKARKYTPFYVRGADGRKQYFKEEADRDLEYDKRIKRAELYGLLADPDLSSSERRLFADLKREADEAGRSIREIFDAGLRHISPLDLNLNEVAKQFLDECEDRVNKDRLSRLTASGYRWVIQKFAALLGDRPMEAITAAEIERFVSDCASETTERNHLVALRRLWRWAQRRKLIKHSPFDQITIGIPPRGEPAVWSVEQVAELFELCQREPREVDGVMQDDHRPLLPVMILQWFAGVRPMTSTRLHWENIRFDVKKIRIPAVKGKVKKRPHVISDLPETFWVWMEPHRKESGLIAPPNVRRRLKKLHKDLGYNPKTNPWPEDVARHSFATYLLDLWQSLAKVAIVLGHRGHTMLLDHYLGLEIERGDGEKFFALRPKMAGPCSPRSAPAVPTEAAL